MAKGLTIPAAGKPLFGFQMDLSGSTVVVQVAFELPPINPGGLLNAPVFCIILYFVYKIK
jgi:hypothetical protein